MAARFPDKTFMQPVLDKNLGAYRDNIDKEIVKGHGPKFGPKRFQNQVPTKNWRASRFAGPARKIGISGRGPGTTPKKSSGVGEIGPPESR